MGFRINRPVTCIPAAKRATLPVVGSQTELSRRLETLGGFVRPGPLTIAAAFYDGCGYPFVNLSRGDHVVASGVSWPLGGAQ